MIPDDNGVFNVIDPVTKKEIGKLNGAFDIKQIQNFKTNRKDTSMSPGLYSLPYGDLFLLTSLDHFTSLYYPDNTQSVYEISKQKNVYSERSNQGAFHYMDIYPIKTYDNDVALFQKVESLDSTLKRPIIPNMPIPPDYSKMTQKEAKKAQDKYLLDLSSFRVKLGEWRIKIREYTNPKNSRIKIYTDVACTNEYLSIEKANEVKIYGNYLLVKKETTYEIYDLNTKKMLYTIYLI